MHYSITIGTANFPMAQTHNIGIFGVIDLHSAGPNPPVMIPGHYVNRRMIRWNGEWRADPVADGRDQLNQKWLYYCAIRVMSPG